MQYQVKYEEYQATGTIGINTSKVHQTKDKDSTVSRSSAATILDGNANRKKQAEKQAKKDNVKRFGS